MTDSVKEWVRRAASMRRRALVSGWKLSMVHARSQSVSGLSPPDPPQRRANELRRTHPLRAVVERAPHRLLRVSGGIAERHERTDRVFGSRRAAAAHPRLGARALELLELVGEVEHEQLRLLASDARHRLQGGDVLLTDGAHQAIGRQAREQAKR